MVVDSTDICNAAQRIHSTTPVVSAALGRTLTAACLLGSLLKADTHSLTLQIKGDGPIGLVTAVSDATGNVRGYAQEPNVMLPKNAKGKLDVAGAVGRRGVVSVMRDYGLKEPYHGQTPIVSGEIAEDITHYLHVSEQTPCAVGLGVLVDRDWSVRKAGGFLVEVMPGAAEGTVAQLEETIASLPTLTDLLEGGNTPNQIFLLLFRGFDTIVLEQSEKQYLCACSRDRMERALIALGAVEIQSLVNEGEPVEIKCQFCGERHAFNIQHLCEMQRKLI